VFTFECPNCGERTELKDERAGQEVRCPSCGARAVADLLEVLSADRPQRRPRHSDERRRKEPGFWPKTWSEWSFASAVTGFILCPGVFGVVAAILGVVALAMREKRTGYAVAGIVVGFIQVAAAVGVAIPIIRSQ
jgi:DNA-directed RNA polymerase subunit RPC12/RpoP